MLKCKAMARWCAVTVVGTMFGCFVGSSVARADDIWLLDFEKAKQLAAKEEKDLLIEFTGSDWCPPCKQLAARVLHTEVFEKKIPGEFVLLKVDRRNDTSGQSEAEQKMVKEMLKKYQIEGFPTIMLLDSQGQPYASRVGYSGAAADQYVDELIKLKAKRAKRDELMQKAQSVKGDDKAKLLAQVLDLVGDDLAGYYSQLIDEIVAADPDDSTGLKSKYAQLKANREFDKALQALLQSLTSKDQLGEAAKKIDELLEKHHPGAELHQQSLFLKFRMLYESNREAAREALEAAIKVDPNSAMAGQLKGVMRRAFKESEKKEEKKDGDSK